jgi:8-oxo-dGTP diphosphatase
MFDYGLGKVALIRKNKPEWQKGKLNGIGGHIEEEKPIDAMCREFSEETTHPESGPWNEFAHLIGDDFEVFCFACFGNLGRVKSKTEEIVEIHHVDTIHPLRGDMIENLPWLIALAVDCLADNMPNYTRVEYPIKHRSNL